MALPPISPLLAAQLGVAAHAAGSAAASAFSDLLRSAADFLKPLSGPATTAASGSPTNVRLPAAAVSDLTVLNGQIESLLTWIAERVRDLVAAGGRSLPADGLSLSADGAGGLAAPATGDGPAIARLLSQDDLLGSLVRALGARVKLRDAATAADAPAGPLRLHVDARGARTIAA